MRIIIGISGASGVVMGYEILKALRAADVETHLVVTEAAAKTLACERFARLPGYGGFYCQRFLSHGRHDCDAL